MIIIEDKIISEDIIEKEFVCNLSACKGQCCVLGEEGAPLTEDELGELDDVYETVKPLLTEEGIAVIEAQGRYVMNPKGHFETPLIEGGACVYLNYDDKGIAKCQIENAFEQGLVDFKKPISCHLYPIRVTKLHDMDALNYSKWEICDPACTLGKELQVPIYKFLKEPIERKYGEGFYEQLAATAKAILEGRVEKED